MAGVHANAVEPKASDEEAVTGTHAGTDAIARMVAAIFSENIPYLTGETIYVDGGQGIAH